MSEPPISSISPKSELSSLERLIEFEVARLNNSRKEAGWSPWLLLVGICTAIEQVLDRPPQDIDWRSIGLIWACAVTFLAALVDLIETCRPWPGLSEGSPRFFSSKWILGSAHESVIASGLLKAGAALAVFTLANLTGVLWWFWCFYAIFRVAVVPLALAALKRNSDLSFGGRGLWDLTEFISMVFSLTVAALAAVVGFRAINAGIELSALRGALLLAASSQLLTWLAEHRLAQPIETRLIQLRRGIGLGELNAADATRILDETLHGVKISEVLEKNLSTLGKGTIEIGDSAKRVSVLLLSAANAMTQMDLIEAESILCNAKLECVAIESQLKHLREKGNEVRARLLFLVLQRRETLTEAKGVSHKIGNLLKDADLQHKISVRDLEGAKGALAQMQRKHAS